MGALPGSLETAAPSASWSDSTRPGWFAIEADDGVITVEGSLDREQLLDEDEQVQLQVTVGEPPSCLPTSALCHTLSEPCPPPSVIASALYLRPLRVTSTSTGKRPR